jgi:nicotinamide mononucleotide adenylyltransferase
MKSLAQFIKEADEIKDFSEHKPIVIAPGRFNPPHRGHKLVIDKLVALGEELGAQPVVLIIDSGKYGPKNPLKGEVRKKYLQKMFPEMRFEVYKNPYEAVDQLSEKEQLIPVGGVAGEDRGNNYKGMVGRIFGEQIMNEYHSEVLHRDPDADIDDVKGISGTKAREAALEGDVPAFRAMTGLDDKDARDLMKQLVDGIGTDGVQSV